MMGYIVYSMKYIYSQNGSVVKKDKSKKKVSLHILHETRCHKSAIWSPRFNTQPCDVYDSECKKTRLATASGPFKLLDRALLGAFFHLLGNRDLNG